MPNDQVSLTPPLCRAESLAALAQMRAEVLKKEAQARGDQAGADKIQPTIYSSGFDVSSPAVVRSKLGAPYDPRLAGDIMREVRS